MSGDKSPDICIFTGPNQPQPQKQQQNQGAAKTPGEDLGLAASARQLQPRKTPGEDAAPALPRVPDGFFGRVASLPVLKGKPSGTRFAWELNTPR